MIKMGALIGASPKAQLQGGGRGKDGDREAANACQALQSRFEAVRGRAVGMKRLGELNEQEFTLPKRVRRVYRRSN